jgi:hypothetical protein
MGDLHNYLIMAKYQFVVDNSILLILNNSLVWYIFIVIILNFV